MSLWKNQSVQSGQVLRRPPSLPSLLLSWAVLPPINCQSLWFWLPFSWSSEAAANAFRRRLSPFGVGCWFSPERSESGTVIRALGEDGHVAVTSLSSWPCTQTHHSASHSGPAWHLVDSHHRRPEHSLGLILKVTDWQFLHVLLGLASVFVSLTDHPSQENLRINTYYFLSTKALCAHYTHSNAPDTRDGGVLHISPCILCTAEVSVVPRVPKELRYWLFSIHTLAGSQTQHESISVTEERWIYGEVNISFMFSGLGIGPSFPSC